MKNILKTSIFAFLLIALGSCTTQEDNPVAIAKGAAKLLTPATGTSLILIPENEANIATTLVWNFSNSGIDSPAKYTVQIAKGGTNFLAPSDAGTSESLFLSWTVKQLNDKLKELNFAPFAVADIDVRIKSSLGSGTNALIQYSNVIKLKVTPYTTDLPLMSVPGTYQSGGNFNPLTASTIAASAYGNKDFEGYVWLTGGFLFTGQDAAGVFSWSKKYGDDGTFSGILKVDGSDCNVSTAGYYLVKANPGSITTQNPGGLTYSSTPITRWDITGDATPISWPDATNGNNSTPMTYNSTTKKWSITIALTGGKQIKFRANNAWTINIGKFDVSKTNNEYGGVNMSYNGGNIDIATSGTYIVTLDMSSPRDYKYTIVLQ